MSLGFSEVDFVILHLFIKITFCLEHSCVNVFSKHILISPYLIALMLQNEGEELSFQQWNVEFMHNLLSMS